MRSGIKKAGFILTALLLTGMLLMGTVSADGTFAEKTYTTTDDFNEGAAINVVTADDEVKLDDTTKPLNIIYVAVSNRGTVVKINTDTGEVLGEYRTSPDGLYGDPSRTTVDKNGSVWVANRNGQSVTRICTPESELWEDRNENGVCDTSAGLGDIRPWSGAAVSGAEDECIINYVSVSSGGTRHISVDEDNNVWVSGIYERIFDKIDGATGDILWSSGPFPAGGYGGLIDKNNVIWSQSSGKLLIWNTVTNAFTTYPVSGNDYGYGLGIDSAGNVWNSCYGVNSIRKFAPSGALIGSYPQGNQYAQGVCVDRDGDVWVAHSLSQPVGAGTIGHLNNDGTFVGNVTGLPCGATGVAVDAAGFIWATCYQTGKVVRINPAKGPLGTDDSHIGEVDMTVELGSDAILYNYSDMTGSTLQGAPNKGTWTAVFDSGIASAKWGHINWNELLPGNSAIAVFAATSGDNVTFTSQVPVTKTEDFEIADGQYIKITVSFTRSTEEGKLTPVLLDLTVKTENSPPDTSDAYPSVGVLWPPNNKMVDIEILGVTDPDGDDVAIVITGITSDEATATEPGAAGEKHAPDASGVGTAAASLRAERSGTADGRVYVISFTATDIHGAVSTGSVAVCVPHDFAIPAVDSGQLYDATVLN